MQLREAVVVPCSPEAAFALVDDLSTYQEWLTIVASAGPERSQEPTGSGSKGNPEPPAWEVELRGRLGPLARSKRLRMERTRFEPPSIVTFERRELDGREHASWTLSVEVAPAPEGAEVTMELCYGGRFATAVIERLLREEVQAARHRLVALAQAS